MALAGLLLAGLAVACVLGLAFFVVKVVFWAIFLPFRLLFKLMWVPIGLVMGALSLAAGVKVQAATFALVREKMSRNGGAFRG